MNPAVIVLSCELILVTSVISLNSPSIHKKKRNMQFLVNKYRADIEQSISIAFILPCISIILVSIDDEPTRTVPMVDSSEIGA